ncbi:MAG TPA: SRPBCC family protein, partial [Anaerolineales bacterium]|nr:SRPBCC family protein [Anaerolineales bacterium]
MIQHEVSIHLDKPVEQVFAFLMDTGKLATWQSNLIKSEQLTEGPLRAGSRFREVRRINNKETEIEGEITSLEPNRRLETKTFTKPQAMVSYSLDPEQGGTRLRYKFILITNGLMRLLEPVIASSIKKDTEADFETLKRM